MRLACYMRSSRPRARRFRFEQWLQRMLDAGISACSKTHQWEQTLNLLQEISRSWLEPKGAGMVRSNAAMVWYALMPPAVAH